MKQDQQKLFSPFKINGCEVKNRCVSKVELDEGVTTFKGMFTTHTMEYYERRAEEGVGMIVTGKQSSEMYTSPQDISDNPSGAETAEYIHRLKKMVNRVHHFGTKVFADINTRFESALPGFLLVRRPKDTKMKPVNKVVELNRFAEEEKTIDEYVKLATVARIVGFDGIQVDITPVGSKLCNHNFIVESELASKRDIKREMHERIAFAEKVVESIKIVCGDDFPVMLNIKIDDEFIAFTQTTSGIQNYSTEGVGLEFVLQSMSELETAGFDAFNVDITASSYQLDDRNNYLLKRNLVLINKIKQRVNIPVILEAFKEQKSLAKSVLSKGFVDAIGVEDSYMLRHDLPFANERCSDQLSNYSIA